MLSQKHRFHRRNHIKYVYKHGASIRQQAITIKYVQNPKHESYRVGVVVSKKVSKLAVSRNRIRRRVYEVIRAHSSSIPAGTDLVVTVFSEDVLDMNHSELSDKIAQMLTTIKV